MAMGFNTAGRERSRDMRLQGASLGDLKNSKTVWRMLGFVLKNYKAGFLVVMVCIVVSSLATLASTLFTRTLIDDYITPMTFAAGDPDYGPLAVAIFKLMAVLLVGVGASYAQSLIMIHVGQGTMRKLRDSLFSHMESLPLGYFDTHSHGDTMSVYTNVRGDHNFHLCFHDRPEHPAHGCVNPDGAGHVWCHAETGRTVKEVFHCQAAEPRKGERLH